MSLSAITQCSVGKVTLTECHKLHYTKVKQVTKIDQLSAFDQNLLISRFIRSSDQPLVDICEHHKVYYLKKYSKDTCCDPFNNHGTKIKLSLRTVTKEFSEESKAITDITPCVPGQQICNNCRVKIQGKLLLLRQKNDTVGQPETTSGTDTSASESSQNTPDFVQEDRKEESLTVINNVLANLEESPIKLHSVSSHQKPVYGKRKVEAACSALKSKVSKVLGSNFEDKTVSHEIEQKAADLDALIDLIQKKMATGVSRSEKIQLLTLAPTTWSIEEIKNKFNVSSYMVRQARSLLNQDGLLAVPKPRNGKKLDQNTVSLVKNFYEHGDYSRILPGLKDKVSVAKNTYEQKRLLLANLNELYAAFKFEHPDCKIGFSKFCSLRPQWCVLSGSSGTHAVCVCTLHQNVKLLLVACDIEESYHELIDYLVCSRENKDCMLRHCPKCPNSEKLKQFLIDKFEEWDPEDEVPYSMWISTGRTQQATFRVPLEEYVDILLKNLELLIPHSYIAKAQSKFLKEKKANLKPNEAILILDFSQNYSYCIQDEAQGYYWVRSSCSLHPVVLYTFSGEAEPVTTCLCMISDDLDHDVGFVYETQKTVITFIKDKFSAVNHINYFSDGCAGQYKNYKNFINLCYHEEDFQMSATWSFFATSHGKSPSDGIGGTTKRLLRKASLQIDCGENIDTAAKVYKFCDTRIDNIKYWFLPTEKISESRQQLEDRFTQAKTIPGTRSYHHFEPLSTNSMKMKRVSCNTKFNFTFNFSGNEESKSLKMNEISNNSYIACSYDDHWFYGIVLSKHEDEGDVRVKFMCPYGPSPSFYWPSDRDDICFVPLTNIITCVEAPLVNASGRVYRFSEKESSYVEEQYALRFRQA